MMKKLKLHLRMNPIIVREFRGHMSGPRAFLILTGYLLGLGVTAYALYRIIMAAIGSYMSYGAGPQSAMIGQLLFVSLAFLEMACVCFITPALTAGTISSEYERRTYDVLMATPLRPLAILWGKMVPALSYILLLILAAIPMFSIVFLFGGVMIGDILRALALLVLTTITLGMVGIFFSALTRRTGRAAVWSYVVVAFLVIGTIFGWVAWSAIGGSSGTEGIISPRGPSISSSEGAIMAAGPAVPANLQRILLYLNPFSALTSATMTTDTSQNMYMFGNIIGMLFSLSGGDQVVGTLAGGYASHPLWHYTVCIYLVLTAVLYLLTAHLVRPIRRWRFSWETAVGLVVIVALLGSSYLLVFRPAAADMYGGEGALLTPTPAFEKPFPPPIGVPVPVEVVPPVAPELNNVLTPTPTPAPGATP